MMSINVRVISVTNEPLIACAMAARTCTSSTPIDDLAKMGEDGAEQLVKRVLRKGHESIAEFVDFTFLISGISRACSHQLVRYRVASYAQQSQRYVRTDVDNSWFTTPPSIAGNLPAMEKYLNFADSAAETYKQLIELGIPEEDARFVLPNAATTQIVVKMNGRELIHFCQQRTCQKAQWEIRSVAFAMLREARHRVPFLFAGKLFPDCDSKGECETCTALRPSKRLNKEEL